MRLARCNSVCAVTLAGLTLMIGGLFSGCLDSSLKTLTQDGRVRTYRVHVPATYSAGNAVPLVIALHQFTSSGAGMEALSGFDAISDREGFISVYPDGVARHWNTDTPSVIASSHSVDDTGFIVALLDQLERDYSIDTTRVYVAGASNAALFTYALACRMPERIAAIAAVKSPITTALVSEGLPALPMPLIAFHGTADPIIPFTGGEVQGGPGPKIPFLSVDATAQLWAEHNGCLLPPITSALPDSEPNDGTTVTQITYSGCGQTAEVILYAIQGGGHTWPGGHEQVPAFVLGKTCRDINASELIWSFFKQHSR